MKKLSQKEFDQFVPKFKKNIKRLCALNRATLDLLDTLKIGESILIELKDWHSKTPPAIYINSSYRQNRREEKFKIYTLIDGFGWVVTRIK